MFAYIYFLYKYIYFCNTSFLHILFLPVIHVCGSHMYVVVKSNVCGAWWPGG